MPSYHCINPHNESPISTFYEIFNFQGEFLKQKNTRELFKTEQHLPSNLIDRESYRGWTASGGKDAFSRAKYRTKELLDSYTIPEHGQEKVKEINKYISALASKVGMDALPDFE